MKRPLGVSILAILSLLGAILFGLIAVVIGIIGVVAGNAILGIFAGIGVVIFFLFAVFNLVKFIGLWTMKPWGWWLIIILSVLSMFSSIGTAIASKNMLMLSTMAWDFIIIIYMWLNKRVFGIK